MAAFILGSRRLNLVFRDAHEQGASKILAVHQCQVESVVRLWRRPVSVRIGQSTLPGLLFWNRRYRSRPKASVSGRDDSQLLGTSLARLEQLSHPRARAPGGEA